jgi:hypothetical protein
MSHRAIRMQDACLLPQPQTSEQKARGDNALEVRNDLHLYVRYQVQNDRAYQRASQELMQRRKERLKAEIGFERKKHAEAQEERRQNAEIRKAEYHTATMSLVKKRIEREENRSQNHARPRVERITAAASVEKLIDALETLERAKIAA